jgi:hypothetical protein
MMNDFVTGGSAQISTSVKKYGTGSISFNGSTDYITNRSTPSLQLNSGDFTVEFWMYATTLSPGYQRIVVTTNGAFGSTDFVIRTQSSQLQVYCGSGNNYGGGLTINSWYHVAVVRNGSGTNNVTTYINGTSAFQFTSTANITTPIQFIGGYYTNNSSEYFNGYIDDLRITNGIARYTTNFTPSTTAFVGQ